MALIAVDQKNRDTLLELAAILEAGASKREAAHEIAPATKIDTPKAASASIAKDSKDLG
jgi:hypothetical protein